MLNISIKIKISLLLGIIVMLLLCWLRKIKQKEGFDLFDNAFTSLGKKAKNAYNKAGDYIDDNTSYIFIRRREHISKYGRCGEYAEPKNECSLFRNKTESDFN